MNRHARYRRSLLSVPARCVMAYAGPIIMAAGCGSLGFGQSAPLFAVPLEVEGEPIGMALVDTGGGYEIMLNKSFGLDVVDSVDVVAFGGVQRVNVTEGFSYTAGGVKSVAGGAIIGEGICDCNGLGFHFFRKTRNILAIDFTVPTVAFLLWVPPEGVTIAYAPPSERFSTFDTAFIEVTVSAGDQSRSISALLDTGANSTVMRRGLLPGEPTIALADKQRVIIARADLGAVAASVSLYDNDGLPDMIIGTDVMRVLGDRWYFSFVPGGGTVTVASDAAAEAPSEAAAY